MITGILNNKSAWKLLALMSYSPGAGYTRNELLRLLKWNNLSLDRAIEKLVFHKIITKNGRVLKLDFSNEETKALLEIIEHDKKKLNYPQFELLVVLVEFLRLVENENINEIYLFGSHAKKTAAINSDIDIAVFAKKNLNLIEAVEKIRQDYKKAIQVHYFALKDKSKIVDEVRKHGVKLV